MSYETWHNYGYGICVSDIRSPKVQNIAALLNYAPIYRGMIEQEFKKKGITVPTEQDYYDIADPLGLAEIMRRVIWEAEHVALLPCCDYDGVLYLLFEPFYPWTPGITQEERSMAQDKLDQMFDHYCAVLTPEHIKVDYQEVENGG